MECFIVLAFVLSFIMNWLVEREYRREKERSKGKPKPQMTLAEYRRLRDLDEVEREREDEQIAQIEDYYLRTGYKK